MTTNEEFYQVWAPENATWSKWAKPVLFSFMEWSFSDQPPPPAPTIADCLPPAADRVALVIDLPGAESVAWGLALANRGYRPVPLFNAVPIPVGDRPDFASTGPNVVAVDVRPIIAELRRASEPLAQLPLVPEAPPAFLLDAHRAGNGATIGPGQFDNRSISFTTDFPSANFLFAHGIQRALVIQRLGDRPQPDLAHTLLRWQEAGLRLEILGLESVIRPVPLHVEKPPLFQRMFQRALATFRLTRSSNGGFGNWIPDSSSGG